MRVYLTIAAVLAATATASAEQVPLPRPRPPGLASVASPEPSACQVELGSRAVFAALPPLVGPGNCGAPDVVRLEAVVLADHSRVAIVPPAVLRCTTAEAIVHWVRERLDVANGEIAEGGHGASVREEEFAYCGRSDAPASKPS